MEILLNYIPIRSERRKVNYFEILPNVLLIEYNGQIDVVDFNGLPEGKLDKVELAINTDLDLIVDGKREKATRMKLVSPAEFDEEGNIVKEAEYEEEEYIRTVLDVLKFYSEAERDEFEGRISYPYVIPPKKDDIYVVKLDVNFDIVEMNDKVRKFLIEQGLNEEDVDGMIGNNFGLMLLTEEYWETIAEDFNSFVADDEQMVFTRDDGKIKINDKEEVFPFKIFKLNSGYVIIANEVKKETEEEVQE